MSGKAVLGLLLQTFAAFTVLFLGWGFDDVGGFFAHPARAGLIVVVMLSLVAILVLRLDVQVFRTGKRPVGGQRWLLAALLLGGMVMVFLLPSGDRRGWLTVAVPDGLRYLGLALYVGGNVLAFAAVTALAKQYSGYVTLQDGHQLVQHGIYGAIRHPIYLRALLVGVGLPLVFRSWLWVPFLLVIAVFVSYRIWQEEKLLAEHFGAEFETYRQRTWRLLPYVY